MFNTRSTNGMRRGIYALVLYALFMSTLFVQTADAAETRDWRIWPFSQDSPWNHPIGSNAQYTTVNGLTALSASINYDDAWTSSVVVTEETDPMVDVLLNTSWPTDNWSFLSNGGKKL